MRPEVAKILQVKVLETSAAKQTGNPTGTTDGNSAPSTPAAEPRLVAGYASPTAAATPGADTNVTAASTPAALALQGLSFMQVATAKQAASSSNDCASDSSEERKEDKQELNGAIIWECVLKKKSETDKFGFLQVNGKLDFETRLMAKAVPAMEQAQPQAPEQGPATLIVKKIHEGGLMERWNVKHPALVVGPNDRIQSVNGKTTVDAMQQEIRTRRVVLRCARYPERFQITLRKDGNKLGLRFESPKAGQFKEIVISEVAGGGAVALHNKAQVAAGRWDLCILPGMSVETANNATGDAAAIAEQLRSSEEVVLLMNRDEHAAITQAHAFQRRAQGAPPP